MKMSKSLKNKWLKALRSGKYKQARGTLYDPDTKGFCCLGVLEREAMNGKVESFVITYSGIDVTYFESCPSPAFYEAFGIKDKDGTAEVSGCKVEAALMRMNDATRKNWGSGAHKYGFEAIANYIEKHVETY